MSVSRQVLRFVDDQHRTRAQGQQPEQKVVNCFDQLLLADACQAAALDVFARDHAEILQDQFEEIFFGQERVEHQRRKRVAIDLFEQHAAQRGFAGTDVARDDREPLTCD